VLENFFIPGVVVVALLIGAWAAGDYNDDANIFIKPWVACSLPLRRPAAAPGCGARLRRPAAVPAWLRRRSWQRLGRRVGPAGPQQQQPG
jgi:hypothetical protein